MPRKGGKRKKTRTHAAPPPEGAQVEAETPKEDLPKSIVAKVGKVVPSFKEAVREFRKIMEPNTASNLKERSYNKIKDFAAVASTLGVSHLIIFSQTKNNLVMRICRHPSGPTVHLKVVQYSLCRHVRALQRRPYESHAAYLTPPLIVLNNFGQAENSHIKLVGITLQHMFPSINVKTIHLSECRRVVLFHYKKETDVIEMRHYAVRANPVGVNRTIKKIVHSKIPNLGELKVRHLSEYVHQDISEFIDGYANAGSDSEAEDETAKVVLHERFIGRGNSASQQSAIRLAELGPRFTLEPFKVERGVAEGEILYHKYETKSPAEIEATRKRIDLRNELKESRRKEQEGNVARKQAAREEKARLREERKRLRLENGEEGVEEEDVEESDGEEDEANDFVGEEGERRDGGSRDRVKRKRGAYDDDGDDDGAEEEGEDGDLEADDEDDGDDTDEDI